MENIKIRKLDIRFNGKLDPQTSILFNQISTNKRSDFNVFITKISEPNINSIDWWVEGPASRNTVASPLFHRYCSIFLILDLIDQKKFNFQKVLVDSLEVANLTKQILINKNILQTTVVIDAYRKGKGVNALKKIFLEPALFLKISFRFIAAKLTKYLAKKINYSEPLVLIDTFMLPDYTDSDRWYGSLWKNLTSQQRESVYFVPTIVITGFHQFVGVFLRLRKNERNFIIKEDFLKFSDLFFAFGVRKRIKKLSIPITEINGFDFVPVLKEELYHNRDILTVFEALLLYRFIKRLSQKKIKIKIAVDWFEGQSMDKAWNLGFKNFFPNVKRIGFRAFESYPFYLCSYPIALEKYVGVIPDVFAVQGKGTIPTVREFLADMPVMVVPSFRSEHVWDTEELFDISQKSLDSYFNILVTLPIKLQTAIQIVSQLISVSHKVESKVKKEVKYILKLHPACPIKDDFQLILSNLPSNFSLTLEKSFPKMIKIVDLLVSEASSTCLEALACGLPVIVIQNREGLTYDPIPTSIPKQLYESVYSDEHLIFALQKYINRNSCEKEQQWKDGKWVRENYFEKVTTEGILQLIENI